LFGVLWIISQGLGFVAISSIGYAVAPAIWIGATIITSFVWGLIFHNPVKSWIFAILAIVFLLLGVNLSAISSVVSDREGQASVIAEDMQGGLSLVSDGKKEKGTSAFVTGAIAAVLLGLCNGSLMVCMTCFGDGCPSIGVEKYTGTSLPSLAFLPSLALGVLVAQPPLFLGYWARSMRSGRYPEFHVKAVALPGLLTGCYWGLGNFAAMFATVYLGQTIGFPLSQCCLILNGLWGILYYREIRGTKAIATFAAGAVAILVGAAFLGLS
jgi:glucose uptake protein GlcU